MLHPVTLGGCLFQLAKCCPFTLFVLDVVDARRCLSDVIVSLPLQWIPTHPGIPGNGAADALAFTANVDDAPTLFVEHFIEAKRIIRVLVSYEGPDEIVGDGRLFCYRWQVQKITIINKSGQVHILHDIDCVRPARSYI